MNDLDNDSFNISMSLHIRSLPDLAPLTIRASIDRDEIYGNTDMLLPRVSNLVFVTGCVMAVERRVAYVNVIDVDSLTLSGDEMDSVI